MVTVTRTTSAATWLRLCSRPLRLPTAPSSQSCMVLICTTCTLSLAVCDPGLALSVFLCVERFLVLFRGCECQPRHWSSHERVPMSRACHTPASFGRFVSKHGRHQWQRRVDASVLPLRFGVVLVTLVPASSGFISRCGSRCQASQPLATPLQPRSVTPHPSN